MPEQLTDQEKDGIYIVGGFAHPELAAAVAEEMGLALGGLKQKIHPGGEIYSRFTESVRGRHVIILQPHVPSELDGRLTGVNDALIQQCLIADAARSSSAAEITAVSASLAYTRQDRKSKGREPIGVRMVIDHLAASGVDRIVTVDMHSSQAQGIFRGPFDHLTAQPLLRKAMREEIEGYDPAECLVVVPDAGAAKMGQRHAQEMGSGMLQLIKMRDPQDSQKIQREDTVPEAEGRVCILFDDMIDTAGTLVSAAEALRNSGAKAVLVAATHPVFSDPAIERLQAAPIDRILVADTFRVDHAQSELGEKLRVVSVAPVIGKALTEIVRNGSVSEIFDDQNHM